MRQIERISRITVDDFVARYVIRGAPVVVTDGMDDWNGRDRWTPEYFDEHFGLLEVPVFDSLFSLVDLLPLGDFLKDSFNRNAPQENPGYVRWYSRFKNIDLSWSDRAFELLLKEWDHPYFLPRSSYVLPFCAPPDTILASESSFPYKGLFLSPAGARTRLHIDPFGTDAVLCQFFGTKALTLYRPSEQRCLRRGNEFFDSQHPDLERFPEALAAKPAFTDELRPGEILYIPAGWLHEVISIQDSISTTWNFAHASKRELFIRELLDPGNSFDRDMISFFFKSEDGRDLSVDRIVSLVNTVPVE